MNHRAHLHSYAARVSGTSFWTEVGRVRALTGMAIEVEGLGAAVGDICRVEVLPGRASKPTRVVLAEVVATRPDHLILLSYSGTQGLATGCDVTLARHAAQMPVGVDLLGRVIDGFGEPLDGGPKPRAADYVDLKPVPRNPMQRPPVRDRFATGVKAVDVFLSLARGQRIGLFAGSGVGKSTLMGSLARNAAADVNVVALIGERGREVREFVELQLGEEALKRSVVVSATADQAAPARVRAAHGATAIAEYFAARGNHVLLVMDSLTRFAMARREVGLAAGEPPTTRGYTPSVFAELPQLCERSGNFPGGGSVTAVMTVLVEGDDMNEPVADHARSILDGHVVLSRAMAEEGRYPSIDVQQSVSRVMNAVVDDAHRELARKGRQALAILSRNRQALEMGLYVRGVNPGTDASIDAGQRLLDWMEQGLELPVALTDSLRGVADSLGSASATIDCGGGARAK